MAINEQPIEFEYIADGNTTTFPFSCRVIYETDLIVQVNGVQVFNFTITGLNNPEGGNIVFDFAPAEGSIISIAREIKLVRETEYQQNGDFLAPTVNKDFDRIWMALQGVAGWFKRALKYPLGGTHYIAENRRITKLAEPVGQQDASSKNYVDTGDARLEDIINELSGNIIQDWIIVKSFQNGATLTLKNQILLNENDGRYYRWLGVYPKIVPSNSTPETTGGFGEKAWALVTIDDTQYLPITGDTIRGILNVLETLTAHGRVAVRNDQNSDISLETNSGEKTGFSFRRFGTQLIISQSANGVVGKLIATYDSDTNIWDFEVEDLTNSGVSVVGVYVGEIRLLPFRTTELPKGWYTCNGFSYDINSPIGQALNKLSDMFKADWDIKVTEGKINMPMMYYDPGVAGQPWQGYFLRPVVGSGKPVDRNPGSIEEDAIRNITGNFWASNHYGRQGDQKLIRLSGAGDNGNYGSGDRDNWMKEYVFDASTVVPVADEIRPKNIGMTPAIFLGV